MPSNKIKGRVYEEGAISLKIKDVFEIFFTTLLRLNRSYTNVYPVHVDLSCFGTKYHNISQTFINEKRDE